MMFHRLFPTHRPVVSVPGILIVVVEVLLTYSLICSTSLVSTTASLERR